MSTTSAFIREIGTTSDAFINAFCSLGDAELNWKPSENSWSIAQIMHHLIVINESYYPVFERIKNNTNHVPFIGRIPFVPRLIGKLLIKSMQPDAKRKLKTFPMWEPVRSVTGICERFKSHHRDFTARLYELETYAEKGLIISSPANTNVVYSLEDAIQLLAVHEKRHYQQAVAVMALMQRKPI